MQLEAFAVKLHYLFLTRYIKLVRVFLSLFYNKETMALMH